MKIIVGYPPNFKAINDKFRIAGRPVLFAWGDYIYNPHAIKVPRSLMEHEKVHSESQRQTIGGQVMWWVRYIEDDEFRLREEVLAHRIEMAERLINAVASPGGIKPRLIIAETAQRLASPIYQYGISVKEAHRLLTS